MTEQTDIRYPIGKFSPPAESSPATRAEQIETIRLAPEKLRAAVEGLSDAQLDTPYRDDGWTVRQIVHHLADSHANSFFRSKLVLTEDCPTVKTNDVAAWAKLPDNRAPIEGSLAMFGGLHERWVTLLEAMTEEDFQKEFNHPTMGRQSLDKNLAVYAWHARHHTAHITGLRARQGW